MKRGTSVSDSSKISHRLSYRGFVLSCDSRYSRKTSTFTTRMTILTTFISCSKAKPVLCFHNSGMLITLLLELATSLESLIFLAVQSWRTLSLTSGRQGKTCCRDNSQWWQSSNRRCSTWVLLTWVECARNSLTVMMSCLRIAQIGWDVHGASNCEPWSQLESKLEGLTKNRPSHRHYQTIQKKSTISKSS